MARSRHLFALAAAGAVIAGCGGTSKLVVTAPSVSGVASKSAQASQQLGYPWLVTKNTTRVAGADPIADAAAVALAVYPSAGSGTHPKAVAIAPTDNWQASVAASVVMSGPVRAPILLSGDSSFPSATNGALGLLAPTGSGSIGGAQVILIGDVPKPHSLHSVSVSGPDAYTLAAGIDRLQSAAQGRPSPSVVIASADDPAYAMPAAGWAAESGDPILFVSSSDIPRATRQALESHQHPHIYVLGPSSVISDGVVKQLGRFGTVKRVGANDPAANSVAFAIYRDPPCASGQPCAHVPGSFGWAMKSPGHGYVLINQNRPLDAAAAAPLSASGTFGPELLVDSASSLPQPVENFFFDYATPGYTQEGPTAAVYNHGWLIGDTNAISVTVQAKVDSDLEPQPVSATSQGPGR
jgi:ell wall binding domain 2 (CWB2)